MLKTSFLYTMPSGMDVWVYFQARDVSSMFLVDPAFALFDKEGNTIELTYRKEIFDDIEDKAHALIYEGEMEEDERQTYHGVHKID